MADLTQEEIDAELEDVRDGVTSVDFGDRKIGYADPLKRLDVLDKIQRRKSTRPLTLVGFAEPGKGY